MMRHSLILSGAIAFSACSELTVAGVVLSAAVGVGLVVSLNHLLAVKRGPPVGRLPFPRS